MKNARIVIVGAGFAGVACARRLRRRLSARSAEIVVFSTENHFVYNPLLAEAVGSSLNPWDVVVPLRELLPDVSCRTEEIRGLDFAAREVAFEGFDGSLQTMGYDHLVIACGNVANLHDVPGMADHAFPLKTVADAMTLRSHVLDRLEWAEVAADEAERRWHLSFVVVGGGYSGVEVAGEINDLVRSSLKLFRRIREQDVKVTLVHSRSQILPEIGAKLREFARERMQRTGVDVLLEARVDFATPEGVGLRDGRFLRAGTVVCTVGTRASPVVEVLVAEKAGGRLVTEPDLRLQGHADVWAIGDCAHVRNGADGAPCPTTAQFGDREGRLAADNVVAALTGRPTRPFSFRPVGQLCSIGGHRAVVELLGLQMGGFFAWLLWRAVYVAKMPAWSRRLQVVFDWGWLLLFPRDLSHVRPRVTERVTQAHYRAGDFVFRRGDAPLAFYVVRKGEVEVIRPTRRNPTGEIVAVLGEGSFFGEQALADDRPRGASVRARTAVDVLVINRGVFTQISRSLAPLRDAFAKSMLRRGTDLWAERGDLLDALTELPLHDLIEPAPQPLLRPETTMREAALIFADGAQDVLYVTRNGGTLDGLITMGDMLRAQASGAGPGTPIGTFMVAAPLALTIADSSVLLATTLQEHGFESMPIVAGSDDRRIAGTVRLRRVMAAAFERIAAPNASRAGGRQSSVPGESIPSS